jgi:hypothetical protein
MFPPLCAVLRTGTTRFVCNSWGSISANRTDRFHTNFAVSTHNVMSEGVLTEPGTDNQMRVQFHLISVIVTVALCTWFHSCPSVERWILLVRNSKTLRARNIREPSYFPVSHPWIRAKISLNYTFSIYEFEVIFITLLNCKCSFRPLFQLIEPQNYFKERVSVLLWAGRLASVLLSRAN